MQGLCCVLPGCDAVVTGRWSPAWSAAPGHTVCFRNMSSDKCRRVRWIPRNVLQRLLPLLPQFHITPIVLPIATWLCHRKAITSTVIVCVQAITQINYINMQPEMQSKVIKVNNMVTSSDLDYFLDFFYRVSEC